MNYEELKKIILNGLNTGLNPPTEYRHCTAKHPLCDRCDSTLNTRELVEKCRENSVLVVFPNNIATGRYNHFFPEHLEDKKCRDYLILDRISWQGMDISKKEGENLLKMIEEQNGNAEITEKVKEQIEICLRQPWTK